MLRTFKKVKKNKTMMSRKMEDIKKTQKKAKKKKTKQNNPTCEMKNTLFGIKRRLDTENFNVFEDTIIKISKMKQKNTEKM